MDRPLSVQCVGNGFQQARWETTLPIACGSPEDQTVKLNQFEAPILSETSSDIPALLGLRSMRSRNGLLEMQPGSERLTFPGPSGYKPSGVREPNISNLRLPPQAITLSRATASQRFQQAREDWLQRPLLCTLILCLRRRQRPAVSVGTLCNSGQFHRKARRLTQQCIHLRKCSPPPAAAEGGPASPSIGEPCTDTEGSPELQTGQLHSDGSFQATVI